MPTTVKFGSIGPDVTLLQQQLGQLGASIPVDGNFGLGTEHAVISF